MSTDHSPSRWDLRKEHTRQRLLASAERLFRAGGFDATTVEEIAAGADVAKGTFFNYFENKASLLGELLHTRMAELLASPPGVGEPAPARIALLFQAMWDELAPYQHLMQQMFAHTMTHPRRPPDLGDTPAAALAALVREGQTQGLFRPEMDAEVAGILLSTLFFRLCLQACLCTGEAPPSWHARMQQGLDILYHGLHISPLPSPVPPSPRSETS